MNEQVLTDDQIEAELESVDVAWSDIPGQGLVGVFEVNGFGEGLKLVVEIGQIAEKLGHYPEITLRPEEVQIITQTPDTGGVTLKDIALVKAIDRMGK
jgi:4a-hydroxytetrahydrobiopterin dehydratase